MSVGKQSNSNQSQDTCSLTVGAVFKNESHILKEWLEHYIKQGVSKFIMIDNESEDSPLEILQDYIDKGIVTHVFDSRKHDQIGKYNQHIRSFLPLVQCLSKNNWVTVIDLDEFLYGRQGNLISFLSSVSDDIGQISVPWKLFGSSGHLSQPASVINGFQNRQKFVTAPMQTPANIKSFIKVEALNSFGIHEHRMKASSPLIHIDCSGRLMSSARPASDIFSQLVLVNEDVLESMPVHLNHYAIQSFEWFSKIKMTRGSANCKEHDRVRNQKYFERYDLNDRFDDELSKISLSQTT